MREAIVTMAHGAGGRASAELIQQVFINAFSDTPESTLQDAASFNVNTSNNAKIAMTTDSYVVSPVFFPGGDIGKMAVCGTVNDLAVSGAVASYLSASFILEEGLTIAELQQIVTSMADAARKAKVKIVTGDTKVVPSGMADKLYITTTGLGFIPEHVNIDVSEAKAGDVIIINGHIGDHGAAVMLARGELGFDADIVSDCAALNDMIADVVAQCPDIRVMRDATRGGVGTVLAEIANASDVSIALEENSLPIRRQTKAVCELLGMDPLFLANEGLAVFCVPRKLVDDVLVAMQRYECGQDARAIGQVMNSNKSLLYINTSFGSKRMIDVPYGIQLPRIC
ncbi:hydrogenase expression/formation protein HypE [Alteromonas facilis]|uniref:hydrogenase expression/formation protein HypE n=1 Tax=Alteromonas facilis TaxID=2048004 RepID=UPI000C28FB72|nr:hydrogenase expression/formation protein HypE [Alteromonas facilis]